jgi:hypothetical protein
MIRCVVAFLSTIVCSAAIAKDLSLALQVRPQQIAVGHRVTFTFLYTNTSDHVIGISPNYRAYQALDLRFRRQGSAAEGKTVPYFSVSFDEDAVKRDLRFVKPGQTFRRELTAKLSSSLPKSPIATGRRPGLYLLFEDSAVQLPGAGNYRVTTRHVARRSTKERLPPKMSAVWWDGIANSAAGALKIQAR